MAEPAKITFSATDAVAITPNDNTVLSPAPRALYVGVSGDVSVVTWGPGDGTSGTTVTFTAVPAGAILPIQVKKVRSTGTSGSSIVGLI